MPYDMPKMAENRTSLQILMQVANIVFKNNLSNNSGSDTRSQRGMCFDKYLKIRSTESIMKTNPSFPELRDNMVKENQYFFNILQVEYFCITQIISVHTSQETQSPFQRPVGSGCLVKPSLFIARTMRNTQMHTVDIIQSFSGLNHVVHIQPLGSKRLIISNFYRKSIVNIKYTFHISL
jgi:hypothetical protein